jgi:hypothetical protein
VYVEDGANACVKKPAKISSQNQNVIKTNHALKQDEFVEMPLTRVRHTHRAVRIICDKYSQNIAILQTHPSFGWVKFTLCIATFHTHMSKKINLDITQFYLFTTKYKNVRCNEKNEHYFPTLVILVTNNRRYNLSLYVHIVTA